MSIENKAYFDSDVIQLLNGLKKKDSHPIFEKNYNALLLSILIVEGELILKIKLTNGHYLIQRLFSTCKIDASERIDINVKGSKIFLQYAAAIGTVEFHIEVLPSTSKINIYTFSSKVLIETDEDFKLNIPFRDTFICTDKYRIPNSPTIYKDQKEGRTGWCFTDFGNNTTGYILYLQDFGALSQMAEDTQISFMDTVKIDWPQLGFQLPHMHNPILKGNKYTIQQAYTVFCNSDNKSEPYHQSEIFLGALREIYPHLVKPIIKKPNLLEYAKETLRDLDEHRGCWKQVKQYAYLNAYINNYDTPPESMVQTAILKPLYIYHQSFGDDISAKIINDLSQNLESFYDEKLEVIHRWLPAESFMLSFEEEHMRSYIMDSWYLHYPLLQLAFLFEQGFKSKSLLEKFEKSLVYLRKAAKHFDDRWPIFFNIYTLEILKEEGNPNEYGEKDTAGLFVLIMVKAYKIFDKKVYLTEAKRAAQQLIKTDFDSIYQSNNTAYAAEALIELNKISPKSAYLKAAEVYLGNVIRNCAIWDMKYGNAKERESFFSLFPLKETLYVAAFEEHETVAIFHRIIQLNHSVNIKLSPHLIFFMAEYIKYALVRMPYYFPPLLPKDILAGEVKSGFVNAKIWIPLEDLGDGWEAVGQVGQEVYGASVFFNLCHHHIVQFDEAIYAISTLPIVKDNSKEISFIGDEHQEGYLWINDKNVQIQINGDSASQGKYTYHVHANDKIRITLKK